MPPCRPRMDNSSVCPFTDDGEPYDTNLLAFKFMIEKKNIAMALEALHTTQLTFQILVDNPAKAQKGILPPRVLLLTLLVDA